MGKPATPQAAVDITLLRQNPVFAKASDEALRSLVRDGRVLSLSPQARFISAGDAPDGVYNLVDGHVRVFHADSEGRQVTAKHLSPPCTLGEMQVLAGLKYIEYAETLTAATLVWVPAAAFKHYLESDHQGTYELLKDICARFCIAARHEQSALFEVPVRLASLLLAYSEAFGRKVEGGVQIRQPLTHSDLANGLGVTVKSVSRAFATWKKEGVVTVHKGWLVLQDMPALEKLCGGLRFNINYRAGVAMDPTRKLDD